MTGNKLLLDTNVIIGYLKGKSEAVEFIENNHHLALAASSITKMELLSFPQLTKEEEGAILSFLVFVELIPLSEEIEEIAIRLRRKTRLKLPDAIICATAIHEKASLVTFEDQISSASFEGLTVINPRKN